MLHQKIITTANLIIVNNKDEIFLAKRSENEKHFAGYRSIPWGKVEDW
jgi:ADP-ribose pyrophosphatase YjhB (NUDIX family)